MTIMLHSDIVGTGSSATGPPEPQMPPGQIVAPAAISVSANPALSVSATTSALPGAGSWKELCVAQQLTSTGAFV